MTLLQTIVVFLTHRRSGGEPRVNVTGKTGWPARPGAVKITTKTPLAGGHRYQGVEAGELWASSSRKKLRQKNGNDSRMKLSPHGPAKRTRSSALEDVR